MPNSGILNLAIRRLEILAKVFLGMLQSLNECHYPTQSELALRLEKLTATEFFFFVNDI